MTVVRGGIMNLCTILRTDAVFPDDPPSIQSEHLFLSAFLPIDIPSTELNTWLLRVGMGQSLWTPNLTDEMCLSSNRQKGCLETPFLG